MPSASKTRGEEFVTAFVLVKTEPGRAFKVLEDLREWAYPKRGPGKFYQVSAHALEAWVVSGEYDVIMKAEAKSVDGLFRMINEIVRYSQKSPGDITSTRTFVASDGIWH